MSGEPLAQPRSFEASGGNRNVSIRKLIFRCKVTIFSKNYEIQKIKKTENEYDLFRNEPNMPNT